MPLTAAERAKKYRESQRQKREASQEGGGGVAPSPEAKRKRQERARDKIAAEIQAQADAAGETVDAKGAARAVVQVRDEDEVPEYTGAHLREALEVGRCCRIWEEMMAGHTAGEDALAEWLESGPELRWLFLAWIIASPWAVQYTEWAEEHLSSGAA